ncbi:MULTISPECIES: hypothetical protein [unclassified Akkermansia]|uniref:hypothetical protein n=1 Tax=unclassified Akkermansia TaxID=2608915 RepID=UPI00129A5EE0|nr:MULTISPECIES: hypothetical protein [unclassified Akkermansia]
MSHLRQGIGPWLNTVLYVFPIPVKTGFLFVIHSLFSAGKIAGYDFPDFFQPFVAAIGRTVCNDAEHFSFKGGYSAESEDSVFPDVLGEDRRKRIVHVSPEYWKY